MPLTEAAILLELMSAGESPRKPPRKPLPEDYLIARGIWPHQPAADQQALERLVPWAEAFSPRVGVDHQPMDAGLLLDVTGVAARHGGEDKLARQLLTQLRQQGYWGQLGWADTLGAAWALAHFGQALDPPSFPETPSPPVSVPVRTRRWIHIAPPGQTVPALGRLPVAALRLSETALNWLKELGVERIEQLDDLPRAGIASRLGAEVVRRWDQARGLCAETFSSHQPAPLFLTRWDAEHPTDRYEAIERVVEHLSHHLAQLLAHQQQGALQLRCRLHCDVCPEISLQIDVNLFQPTPRADYLWQLLRTQLEQLSLPGPVKAVELLAPASAPLLHHQPLLWDTDSAADEARQLSALIDRLSNRLGPEGVSAARLGAGTLPETAYTFLPLVGSPAARAPRNSGRSLNPPSPGHRPLQLLDPPLPVDMISQSSQGAPQQFVANGLSQQTVSCWGPERIEAAWWQGPSVRRDYYRVHCASGVRLWLFRNLKDQRWFLHGEFL
jgi:protein ImuB